MTHHPRLAAGDHVRVYTGSIRGATGILTDDKAILFDTAVPVDPTDTWPLIPVRPAVAADVFLDTLGVNIHMTYVSTTYGNVPQVIDALAYTGIPHVRDGECSTCTKNGRVQQRQLVQAGARFTMISGDFTSQAGHTPEGNVPAAIADAGGQLVAFEGPNEPNRQAGYSIPALVAYYTRLRALVSSNLPILGPAFTDGREFAKFGDQPSVTVGTMHPYPGGAEPSKGIQGNMTLAAKGAPGRPLQATETGYHTALKSLGGHKPVTEDVAAVYMPKVFLEYFVRGVQRTFIYELVDQQPDPGLTNQERHFGLFRADWTPTPAADAIRTLTQTVRGGTPDTVGGVAYKVTSQIAVRDLLLQRGDGTYLLILWRPAVVWDQNKQVPVDVPARSVTITFGQPVQVNGSPVSPVVQIDMAAEVEYLELTAA